MLQKKVHGIFYRRSICTWPINTIYVSPGAATAVAFRRTILRKPGILKDKTMNDYLIKKYTIINTPWVEKNYLLRQSKFGSYNPECNKSTQSF